MMALCIGSKATGISVRSDRDWPGMWRIHVSNGRVSDMVNLSRAKDAAPTWVRGLVGGQRWSWRETAREPHSCVSRPRSVGGGRGMTTTTSDHRVELERRLSAVLAEEPATSTAEALAALLAETNQAIVGMSAGFHPTLNCRRVFESPRGTMFSDDAANRRSNTPERSQPNLHLVMPRARRDQLIAAFCDRQRDPSIKPTIRSTARGFSRARGSPLAARSRMERVKKFSYVASGGEME